MDKKTLRKKYKELRSKLTLDQVGEMSLLIANKCLELPIWDQTYFHVFLSISEKLEVNTEFLLHILQGRDKSIVVSKSNFDTFEMSHVLLQENTALKVSNYGIPEPVDGIEIPPNKLDVVFIPLLGYDTKGNRLGYGKGFYDRFLAQCNKDCIKIGLSLYIPETEEINNNLTDLLLDFCVTPSKIHQF
jgi:5-formyltetrahydrofolate cyclo-ligase